MIKILAIALLKTLLAFGAICLFMLGACWLATTRYGAHVFALFLPSVLVCVTVWEFAKKDIRAYKRTKGDRP